MSLAKAAEYLRNYGLENRIMEFTVPSSTVEEAAKALNCKTEEIVKTLSFIVDGKPILVAVAGDSRIDNKKYNAEFKAKAKMIPADRVEELIGHAVGGVCPFGIKDHVEVYLDDSLKRFTTVYLGCGSSNSIVKMTLAELEKTSNYKKWIDVCKEIQ